MTNGSSVQTFLELGTAVRRLEMIIDKHGSTYVVLCELIMVPCELIVAL